MKVANIARSAVLVLAQALLCRPSLIPQSYSILGSFTPLTFRRSSSILFAFLGDIITIAETNRAHIVDCAIRFHISNILGDEPAFVILTQGRRSTKVLNWAKFIAVMEAETTLNIIEVES
jgi:hypothetical protein